MSAVAVFTASCGSQAPGSEGGAGGEASLEGETITFVVSFGTGGGYDLVARTIAPYLEQELGATVVVENEDGAGGLLAASQLFSAEPDGLTIGFFAGQGIAGATLGGAEGVQFDLSEFSYIARIAADPRVMVGDPTDGYQSIDEVLSGSDVQFASAGTGAADHLDGTVLHSVLDLDGSIVSGYESSEETGLAVTSGDVDIGSGTVSARLPGIKSDDFRPLLIIGEEQVEALPDVPLLTDLDLDQESRELAEAHLSLQAMGRMVWAPPGVPEDRRAALEDAFQAACENPDFLQEMEQADQAIQFTPGAEAKSVAQNVLEAPEGYKSLLEKAYEGQ